VSKNTLKPRLSDYWAIPPDQDAEFVYYMEDVLNLYHEPCDKNHPVICFDESSKILRAISATRSQFCRERVARIDSHYKRNDKQKLHLTTEPLTGWVTVDITDRRRTKEWIDRMVELADDHYPDALDIRVVADHPNTHNPPTSTSSSRQTRRKRISTGSSFTMSKHGSWLNIAEIELGVLKHQ